MSTPLRSRNRSIASEARAPRSRVSRLGTAASTSAGLPSLRSLRVSRPASVASPVPVPEDDSFEATGPELTIRELAELDARTLRAQEVSTGLSELVSRNGRVGRLASPAPKPAAAAAASMDGVSEETLARAAALAAGAGGGAGAGGESKEGGKKRKSKKGKKKKKRQSGDVSFAYVLRRSRAQLSTAAAASFPASHQRHASLVARGWCSRPTPLRVLQRRAHARRRRLRPSC